MFKQIFSIFLNSLAESHKLEERYRVTTTWLGWITVAISCLALLSVMYTTWLMLGLPLEGGDIDGLRLKLVSWIAVTVVLLPVAFLAGMVMVYGAYGLLMFFLRKFTWRQAVDFGCRARYPEYWYKLNA
jgi:hypothetical protein